MLETSQTTRRREEASFRKWSIRSSTGFLHNLGIVRENKAVLSIHSPKERDTSISIHRDEGDPRRTIKDDECKFSFNASQHMISGIGAPISQSTISLNDDAHFICCLRQSVQVFKGSNVLNISLGRRGFCLSEEKAIIPAPARLIETAPE
uniref:Uncharacterized protein n=1 Tax=Opuntia streptacantha TaxID=393608 RepID=A0A7C8YXV6_OPUST